MAIIKPPLRWFDGILGKKYVVKNVAKMRYKYLKKNPVAKINFLVMDMRTDGHSGS